MGLFGLVLLQVGACSDDGGSGPDAAATSADQAAYCDAVCDRRVRCETSSTQTKQECTSKCRGDTRLVGVIRRDILSALGTCYEKIACDENEDGCLTDAAAANGIDAEDVMKNDPQVLKCIAKQDECSSTDGHFSDDICGIHVLFVTSKKRAVEECFDDPCETIGACLGAFD